MVQEIIYTSAEKGLKQGSRGFCTVVSTAGMALNLAERLESMSGYRQAFPLHDPKASLNPVCYSHVTTRLAGKVLHVVSRIADAGQDYTGRSNKLAHHLVLDAVGAFSPGPVRLLGQPGTVVDRWNGDVKTIPPREIRSAELPAQIELNAWKAVCGDEGWAGAIAEQLLQNPAPVSIIFAAGTDTFSLVREVLDLIPASQRWNVTFSTYFTRLLAGTECQLRFVLNDTPEATSLRNDARAKVIDLTATLPPATGGSLVSIARTGVLKPAELSRAALEDTPGASDRSVSAATSRPVEQTSSPNSASSRTVRSPQPGTPSLRPGIPGMPTLGAPEEQRRSRWPLFAGIGFVVLVLGLTVTAIILLKPGAGSDDRFSQLAERAVSESDREVDKSVEAAAAALRDKQAKEKEEQERREQADAEEKKQKEEELAAQNKAMNDAAQKFAKEQEEKKRLAAELAQMEGIKKEGPFAFVKVDTEKWQDEHGQWLFEIPVPDSTEEASPMPLRLLNAEPTISLCGHVNVLYKESPVQLQLVPASNTPRNWILTANGRELGTYSITRRSETTDKTSPDADLRFAWTRNAARDRPSAELARWWPIEISVENQKAVFLQRRSFRPNTRLSWQSLADSNQIVFPSGSDFAEVPFSKSTQFKAELKFFAAEKLWQTVNVPFGSRTNASEDVAEENLSNNSNRRFFKLSSTLQLMENVPESTDDLLALGVLDLNLAIVPNGGVALTPHLAIHARLPKKDLVKRLPSLAIQDQIVRYKDDPRTLVSFPYKQEQVQILTMTKECDVALGNIKYWYFQQWKPLPNMSEWKCPFLDRSKAVRNDKGIQSFVAAFPRPVSEIEERSLNEQAIQENRRRRAVHEFIPSMARMEGAVQAELDKLLKSHPNISHQFTEMEKELQQLKLQFSICGVFPTPGYDNGESVTIRFLETELSTPER